MSFLLERELFRGYVKLREGNAFPTRCSWLVGEDGNQEALKNGFLEDFLSKVELGE